MIGDYFKTTCLELTTGSFQLVEVLVHNVVERLLNISHGIGSWKKEVVRGSFNVTPHPVNEGMLNIALDGIKVDGSTIDIQSSWTAFSV